MFCSKCGSECRADHTACPKCGAPLAVPVTPAGPPTKRGVSPVFWIGVGVVAVIVCLFILLAVVLIPLRSRTQAAEQCIRCACHLKQLELDMKMYAEENHDMLPDGDGMTWIEAVQLKNPSAAYLSCPAESVHREGSDYVFLGNGLKISEVKNPSEVPLFLCRSMHDRISCYNVVFFDGHESSVRLPPELSCEEIVRRLSPDVPEQVLENAREIDRREPVVSEKF